MEDRIIFSVKLLYNLPKIIKFFLGGWVKKLLKIKPHGVVWAKNYLNEKRYCYTYGLCGREAINASWPIARLSTFSYKMPITQGDFTIEKFKGGSRFDPNLFVCPIDIHAFRVGAAGVAGSEGLVYQIDSGLAFVESMSSWWASPERNPILHSPRFKVIEYLGGHALSLLTIGGDCFYHFIVEGIHRSAYIDNIESYDWILVNGSSGRFHKKWLEQCKIPLKK